MLRPRVVSLKDGRDVTVFDIDNILDEVTTCMGHEARRYIERWKADVDEDKEAIQYDLNESEKELEQLNEHQHRVLLDLKQEVDALDELLDAPRLNREKLQSAVWNINKMLRQEM